MSNTFTLQREKTTPTEIRNPPLCFTLQTSWVNSTPVEPQILFKVKHDSNSKEKNMTKHAHSLDEQTSSPIPKKDKVNKGKASQHSLPHPSDHMNQLLPIPPLLTRSLHHPEHESVEQEVTNI